MINKLKIKDIGEIVSGSTPKTSIKEYWNGENYWITPAEIKDNTYFIKDTERKITELAVKKTSLKKLPKGTVLLTTRAPIGKVAIADVDMYCNQGFKNIICNEKIDNRFLYYFLKSKKEYLNLLGRGATFKEISKCIVENVEVPIYSIEEQKKIVNKLDNIQEIINLNQKQIDLADELIKAKFNEMFGDINTNNKKWTTKKGKELFIFSSGKSNAISNLSNDFEYKCYGGNGITGFSREYLIDYDTIIIGRVGAYCGSVHRTEGKIWITDNAIYIKEFKEKSNVKFLEELFKTINFNRFANYSGQPKITQLPLQNYTYIIPPIKLQNQFAEIVKQIDMQKELYQKHLNKVQELMNTLINEYFDKT